MENAFEIIAEPNRRAILSLLTLNEQSVGEIERQLGMSQPAVSKHLRVLRDASIFVDNQDKALRFYTEVLGFTKKADFSQGPYRWLTVAPSGDPNDVELQL